MYQNRRTREQLWIVHLGQSFWTSSSRFNLDSILQEMRMRIRPNPKLHFEMTVVVGFWHLENEMHWKYTFNKAYNNHTTTTNYRCNSFHMLSIIFENHSFLSSSTSQGHISSILRSVLAFMHSSTKAFTRSLHLFVLHLCVCPNVHSFCLNSLHFFNPNTPCHEKDSSLWLQFYCM